MTTELATTSVTTEVDVAAPVEHAFRVFTDGIGTWWNPNHHILQSELAEMVFEPRVGGHIIDRATDGSECRWARVLAYEPPNRVCFSWDINLNWQIETDPAKTSEVEVTFTATTNAVTHVVLTHRHLDRHGEGWEAMRDAVGSGWSLDHFAEVAGSAAGTDERYVAGVQLPVISDDEMRERLAGTESYTAVLLRATDKLVRPDVDAVIWEHGRRNFALREHGVLPIVMPATDDSDWAGIAIFAASPDEVQQIMDHDPGVRAGIFIYEAHPVRGFPGSALPG
jgi:uncharacterized protein YndB with AHSA1/START domain